MMKPLKILSLALGCLLCALALTACHTDADPWPVSSPAQSAPSAPADGGQNQTEVQWGAQPEAGATAAPTEPGTNSDDASNFNG